MPDRGDPPLVLGDPNYPAALRDLADPPRELFVRGVLPAGPAVAIVGSRAATDYGMAIAHRLARDLAGLGYAIVSGLARGIDAAAHRGALDAGGTTVAVLPGGLDPVSPSHHAELAETIAGSGALVAEWRNEMAPKRGMFLRRNRIIAALGLVTVVVEAAERSGALGTASRARQIGRPVLAVPGDVGRPTSQGANDLLRHGAHLCEHAGDVLRAAKLVSEGATSRPRRGKEAGGKTALVGTSPPAAAGPPGATDAARIAAALDVSPLPFETLAARAGLGVERAMAALLQLEWSGVAAGHAGQRWSRKGGG
jgi:DNA processing protein